MADDIILASGEKIATDQIPGSLRHYQKTKLFSATDDSEQGLIITPGGAVQVDGSATTQPVSATTLPLPTLAATSTAQTAAQVTLAAILAGVVDTSPSAVTSAAASQADGHSGTIGATTDATWGGSAAATAMAIFRYIGVKLEAVRALLAGTIATSHAASSQVDGHSVTQGAKSDAALAAPYTAASSVIGLLRALVVAMTNGGVTIITPTLLTRPNDTALYTIGDGIAALTSGASLQELPLFSAGANGTASLVGFQVTTSQKACQGGIRVHFYKSNAVSAAGIIEDNAVFTYLTADQALYQGYIDLNSFMTRDTTSTFAFANDLGNGAGIAKWLTADANRSVWFQYEIINGAFTPDALQTLAATAWVVQ